MESLTLTQQVVVVLDILWSHNTVINSICWEFCSFFQSQNNNKVCCCCVHHHHQQQKSNNMMISLMRSTSPFGLFLVLSSTSSSLAFLSTGVSAFTTNMNSNTYNKSHSQQQQQQQQTLFMADSAATATTSNDGGTNDKSSSSSSSSSMAKYLVDLHDAQETFDFCGGMMFQLVLTDALRNHLLSLDKDKDMDVKVFDSNMPRMYMTPQYEKSSNADDRIYFHGREIRNVPHAKGGMGMVLQLSLANNIGGNNDNMDPEGWTMAERQRYDGWGHDSGREWRRGTQLVQEGFVNFQNKFGPNAYSLHHRFYLHKDIFGRLWLAAEDGCEGTPKSIAGGGGNKKNLSNLFGLL